MAYCIVHSQLKSAIILIVNTDDVLSLYSHFDFMSIDIEGLDYQVLSKLDYTKYRLNCICVESITIKANTVNYDTANDI